MDDYEDRLHAELEELADGDPGLYLRLVQARAEQSERAQQGLCPICARRVTRDAGAVHCPQGHWWTATDFTARFLPDRAP